METEDEDGDSYEDGPEDAGDGTGGMWGLHKVQYFYDVTFPKGHHACCTKLGQ